MTGEYSEADGVPERMYPPRSSNAAFCGQPLHRGEPAPGAGVQWLIGNLGLALVHNWKRLVSVFHEFSAIIGNTFILVGNWALSYHSMKFRHSPGIFNGQLVR